MSRPVVFDLGNVLVTWDRRLLFGTLIEDPAELEHFCDHVLTLEENAKLDRGMPLDAFVDDLAARHPDHRRLIEALRSRWPETLGPVIEGTVDILRELVTEGHRCFALSNWGADTFALIEDRYDFLAWFDGIVISGREGTVKPEPAIFEILCTRHGLDPATTVFIDDSPTNVEAAIGLGFDGIVFDHPARLREELVARSLLAPQP